MESDHQLGASISENPSDGEEQGVSTQVTSRSYECNFCKRGFSNAQALGGHMNIHRKDKAKLKQQQSSNQIQYPKSGHEDISNKPNFNWNVSQQERVINVPKRQLPLFAESPTSSETQNPQAQTTTEQTLLSTQDSSSSELDLELRLGTEPQDSSAETGTRNFF